MNTMISPKPRHTGIHPSVRIQCSQRKTKKLRIRNVLVATDFSPASVEAFEAVLPLIDACNAHLHLVHILSREHPMNGLCDVPLVFADPDFEEQARRRLREIAVKSLVPLRTGNVHVLRGGRGFEQICELARKFEIDLIVVSTRGLSGLKHFALGSTAERVVRYSPCPVLVIRPLNGRSANGDTTHTPLNVRKILVPVDFSNCSHNGVEYAEHLAKQFRASIVLLHSVYFAYHVISDEYARYDHPLFVQEAEKAARVRMQELAREIQSAGIKVEPLLKTGHVGEQICESARAQGVDLIVTSTHGWTGFKHVLLGSNAEYVVQHATCPVLVVPTHQRPSVNLVGSKK